MPLPHGNRVRGNDAGDGAFHQALASHANKESVSASDMNRLCTMLHHNLRSFADSASGGNHVVEHQHGCAFD